MDVGRRRRADEIAMMVKWRLSVASLRQSG
jgi:hypothetical protein